MRRLASPVGLAALALVAGCRTPEWQKQENATVMREVVDLREHPEKPCDVPRLERLLKTAQTGEARRIVIHRLAAIDSEEATLALGRNYGLVRDALYGGYGDSLYPIDARIGKTGRVELLAACEPEANWSVDVAKGAFRALVEAQPGATFREKVDKVWPLLHEGGRRSLIESVTKDDDAASLDWLLARFDEATAGQRIHIARRVASRLYEPGIPVLKRALDDRDPDVRKAALEAFAAFKEHRDALDEVGAWQSGKDQTAATVDQLMALLDSPKREVVIGAARSLGAIRAQRALPKLVLLLERDDRELREAVHEAISRLEN